MTISYNTRKWMSIIGIFSVTVRITMIIWCSCVLKRHIQCIAAMMILQITTNSNSNLFYESQHQQPIQLLPTLRIHMEWLHIFVVLLYTAGLVSTTTTYIHWVRNKLFNKSYLGILSNIDLVFHPFGCFGDNPINLLYMAFVGQRSVYS